MHECCPPAAAKQTLLQIDWEALAGRIVECAERAATIHSRLTEEGVALLAPSELNHLSERNG